MGIRSRIMGRLARHAGFRLFHFFSRSMEGAAACTPAGLPDIRVLSEAEVLALCADPELDLRPESVAGAIERGDVCVGAFDGATLTGYCWLAFSPLHHLDGVWVHFPPDVVWTYKSLVRPSYRGRGIAPSLYVAGDSVCREKGRTRSLISVESHNIPSISAALRAGYGHAGRAAYIRRGSLFADWYSPQLRRQVAVAFALPV